MGEGARVGTADGERPAKAADEVEKPRSKAGADGEKAAEAEMDGGSSGRSAKITRRKSF